MTQRDPFRKCRLLVIVTSTVLIPSSASANAAMGLAFNIFPFDIWLVFVFATVLFEAWAFARAFKQPFSSCLTRAIAANVLTAIVGVEITEVFFHGLVLFGSPLNPNPFLQTLVLFTAFGVVSAFLEAAAWDKLAYNAGKSAQMTSLGVHLAAIPIGLVILLIPAHPYTGLQNQVNYARIDFERQVSYGLTKFTRKNHTLPKARSYDEMLMIIKPFMGRFADDKDYWAADYPAEFGRFSMGKSRKPILTEWNSSAKRDGETDKTQWLTRGRINGVPHGIVIQGDYISITHDPKLLGVSK